MDQLCFCCTTLRDVIFADWYFAHVMSTTGILQHAVVCRVTTVVDRLYSSREVWFLVADPICSILTVVGLLKVIQAI